MHSLWLKTNACKLSLTSLIWRVSAFFFFIVHEGESKRWAHTMICKLHPWFDLSRVLLPQLKSESRTRSRGISFNTLWEKKVSTWLTSPFPMHRNEDPPDLCILALQFLPHGSTYQWQGRTSFSLSLCLWFSRAECSPNFTLNFTLLGARRLWWSSLFLGWLVYEGPIPSMLTSAL